MQKVTVLCVGKLKERFYIDAAAEYAKRLSRHCRLEILELPEQRLPEDPTPGEISAALEREAAAVREKLPRGGALVALCVEGKMLSSPELAKRLMDFGLAGQSQLTFLIGGSVGLHPSLKAQADLRLSMSPMTFPHHLARVMLLEQLYRYSRRAAITSKPTRCQCAEFVRSRLCCTERRPQAAEESETSERGASVSPRRAETPLGKRRPFSQ